MTNKTGDQLALAEGKAMRDEARQRKLARIQKLLDEGLSLPAVAESMGMSFKTAKSIVYRERKKARQAAS